MVRLPLSFRLRRAARRLLRAVICLHLWLLLIITALSLYCRHHTPSWTPLRALRRFTFGHASRHGPVLSLTMVPPRLVYLLVELEDPRFLVHHGIDPGAVMRAFRLNLSRGRVDYGASTITQQLARTLFLLPVRSMLRKYVEAIFAGVMDAVLSKHRIMELYLNSVEWGPNVFGIAAASQHAYGLPPDELHLDQQVRLLTILADPDTGVYGFDQRRALNLRYDYLYYCQRRLDDRPPSQLQQEVMIWLGQ